MVFLKVVFFFCLHVFLKGPKLSMSHVLLIGDEIVAKYPAYRGGESNPYFAGTVVSINAAGGTCTVRYEDGDSSNDVRAKEIYYAPGRPAQWGKADLRGNNALPPGAQTVTIVQDARQRLHQQFALFGARARL